MTSHELSSVNEGGCFWCSGTNVKKWESEMQTLKNNNSRLQTALEESKVNVSQWKTQLQKYKEENDSLKKKVIRHQCVVVSVVWTQHCYCSSNSQTFQRGVESSCDIKWPVGITSELQCLVSNGLSLLPPSWVVACAGYYNIILLWITAARDGSVKQKGVKAKC